MNHDQASFWRRFFLILVIVMGVVAVFCGWMAYRVTPTVLTLALLPTLTFGLVIALEILSVTINRKTLSTNTTKALEAYEKSRVWIYLTLISMVLVLIFLMPHLFITG